MCAKLPSTVVRMHYMCPFFFFFPPLPFKKSVHATVKECIPPDVAIRIAEVGVTTFSEAATLVDEYVLAHKGTFQKRCVKRCSEK